MKIAVVGMGGTGSAAAYWLARAGHDVTGFEQFAIGHTRGSSHGQSRIIRYTYSDDLYTQMMGDAYPLWQEIQAEAGEELLVRTGGVFLGGAQSPVLASAEAALLRHGVPYTRLTPEETHARFPALRLAGHESALFQADMGFLRATACVLALTRLARALGAVVCEQAEVREIAGDGGSRIRVIMAAGEEFVFDRVIVSAGPWMGALLASLHLPLRVTRQQIAYLAPEAGRAPDFEQGRLPVWIDAEANIYGFPHDARSAGVKLASHAQGEDADPQAVSHPVSDRDNARLADYAAARFWGLTRHVLHAETCLYTNTPDEDFLIDTVPGLPQVQLISGCSGHGFKFTILLGRLAAEAAVSGLTSPLLSSSSLSSSSLSSFSRFSLSRFAA